MNKRFVILFVMLVSCLVGWAQVFTLDAKQKVEPGSWLCFRNVIEISDNPQEVCLSIAADSKYCWRALDIMDFGIIIWGRQTRRR